MGELPHTLPHKVRLGVQTLFARSGAVVRDVTGLRHSPVAQLIRRARVPWLLPALTYRRMDYGTICPGTALDGRLEYHHLFGIPCLYLGNYDPRHAWVSRVYAVRGARLPMGVLVPYGA